jgi:DDB1- and CUL4-associated factor 13
VSNDRGILLIDTKSNTVISKLHLALKSNDLAWNPREPVNFTVANEDANLYSFDMRNLTEATRIHKDHVNAVTSLSYSPTGREFASGSFDKTVRIFDVRDGRSREVYHTRRMQWIYAVEFSGDGRFVMTGSDDTNIRVWKSQAHVPLKVMLPKEQEAMQYREKLKKKFQYVPEMRRLLKHRHLPRYLFRQKKIKQIQKESQYRKAKNVQAHTRPENLELIPEKKKVVISH